VQFFIEHSVQQLGAAVVPGVFADGLAGCFLYRALFKAGSAAPGFGLVVSRP
jgi:hypothetical protein